MAYPWPGNVRELSHVVERAALLHPGQALGPEILGLGARVGVGRLRCPREAWGSISAAGRSSWRRWSGASSSRRSGTRDWNRARAAELLGLSRETLRYRIEKFRLAPERASE